MSIPSFSPAYDEAARLVALHQYNILDTLPEPAFDDIAQLATFCCQTPMAAINFVGDQRVWSKALVGLPSATIPRTHSICTHAIMRDELCVIPDVMADPRLADNRFVTGTPSSPGIRFYAGVPLLTPEGYAIGTLCVMDRAPRTISPEQQAALRALARQVTTQLELRRSVGEMQREIIERRRLEEQLQQAQKMEAIGRLAGGIAHDFNNILTIIYSACTLARQRLTHNAPAHRYIDEIQKASERATALIQQLLAFSRKQVVQPRLLYLGTLLQEMEGMIQRLVGAEIQTSLHLTPDLAAIRADPNQIERVLLNLVANARDAMPGGGTLAICAENITHTPAGVEGKSRQWPQPYVGLTVKDSGQGVDPALLPHIFEPFFTTKALDKGTGLGLATVYSIVQQSGGEIQVESQPAQGTTVRILLPAVLADSLYADKR